MKIMIVIFQKNESLEYILGVYTQEFSSDLGIELKVNSY